MDHRSIHDKPRLLMLSHCIPDAAGGPDRVRVWQLLKLASQTHQVRLACVMDGPVNLNQWRTVNSLAQQIIIERHQAHRRLIGKLLRPLSKSLANRFTHHTSLMVPAGRWTKEQRFDTVLCTHPSFWRQIQGIARRVEICDLYTPTSTSNPFAGYNINNNQTQRRRRRSGDNAGIQTIFTIGQTQDRHYFSGSRGRSILLPPTIDLSFFTTQRYPNPLRRQRPPASLDVVFHCDWKAQASNHILPWFRHRIWPAIKQAVPSSRFRDTRPIIDDPATTLSQAAIVVMPMANPKTAHLPILQAMASQRAVVTSQHTIEHTNLGVCQDEHLLLARNDHDWVNHCVGLLRSAQARQRLSHNARAFVERYPTIEQTGQELIEQLTLSDQRYGSIGRAA